MTIRISLVQSEMMKKDGFFAPISFFSKIERKPGMLF